MDIDSAKINKSKIKKSAHKIQGNDLIAEYYNQLYEETGSAEHRAESVKNCFKWWDIDYYRLQKVKDILRVNLCRDKFCPNCQNLISKRRYLKYKPELDKLLNEYSLWHVVFTVPNCTAISLKGTIKTMYAKFVYVVQYLQGKRKVKGLDFVRYGFKGAIRSLEITMKAKNKNEYEFHPHFHCIFALKKGFREERKYINDYSFDGRKKSRYFTDFEILLQKSWYLFYNGEKLTKQRFDEIKQGYSVIADRVNGNYKEIFKYAVKGLYDPRTGSFEYPYEIFKALYPVLHKRKIIQGYGILNKMKFDESDEDEFDELYNEIITELKKIEEPIFQAMRLQELLQEFDEREEIQYISKNSVKGKIKDL